MIDDKKNPEESVMDFMKVDDESPEESSHEEEMYQPESFDEEFDSGGLLTQSQYEIPETADAFMDSEGKVINKEDMTPFEIIKAIAVQNKHTLKDPKKNCKHCFERGYESIDSVTKMPVPCRCLFRGNTEAEKMAHEYYDSQKMQGGTNRAWKRLAAKTIASQFRHMKKAGYLKPAEPAEKVTNQVINQVLKQYMKLDSFKKTAKVMDMTLTKTKNIIKENKTKLEKLRKKAAKGE